MTHDSNRAESGTLPIHPIDEERAINDLHPHPRNSEVFSDLSEPDLRALADDIRAHGLEHAPEILPNGTVLAGHQRLRALRLLGETMIRCRIRYDLEASGPEAIEAWLIKDNLLRRQLSPLAKARACEALLKVQRRGRRRSDQQVREEIGKLLNVSGRHVSRLLRLLTLPRALQDAVDNDTLTMTVGEKIAGLPQPLQQEIAKRVSQGERPAEVAATYLAKPRKPVGTPVALEPPTSSLASQLFRQCEELQRCCPGRIDESDRKIISDAVGVLRSMLGRGPATRRRGPRALA